MNDMSEDWRGEGLIRLSARRAPAREPAEKGRARGGYIKHGRPQLSAQGVDARREAVKRMFEEGRSVREMVDALGVPDKHIYNDLANLGLSIRRRAWQSTT